MDEKVTQISQILHDASETHHTVFKIVDGNDLDWASWYSEWLINLSKLPELLGVKPIRSELTYILVKLDRDFSQEKPNQKWEDYYAQKLVDFFQKNK